MIKDKCIVHCHCHDSGIYVASQPAISSIRNSNEECIMFQHNTHVVITKRVKVASNNSPHFQRGTEWGLIGVRKWKTEQKTMLLNNQTKGRIKFV